jgi:hypothetical protein
MANVSARAVLALLLAMCCGAANAEQVKLIAVNAAKEAIVELAAGFERASGHKVTIAWEGVSQWPSEYPTARYLMS